MSVQKSLRRPRVRWETRCLLDGRHVSRSFDRSKDADMGSRRAPAGPVGRSRQG
jgi:hypothetical protein